MYPSIIVDLYINFSLSFFFISQYMTVNQKKTLKKGVNGMNEVNLVFFLVSLYT